MSGWRNVASLGLRNGSVMRANCAEFIRFNRSFSATAASLKSNETIGFIGLGNMGGSMAKNLLKNKYSVIVYDISAEVIKPVTDAGATLGKSPAEIASKVKTIVTMLPSSPHVQEVYTGKDGIFSAVNAGTLMLDCSTIDPAVSRQIEKLAAAKSTVFMDAPVSGGVVAARDAGLTFMVGGDEKNFEKAKTVLSNMGKNVIHCGAIGTGQAAKICNNMLLAISMIGTSEAMHLGQKLGLDPKVLARVLNTSSGRCWSSELYNPCPGVMEGIPSSNGYKGGFGTSLMTKDLGLAQNSATATQCATPLGSLAHQLYRTMCNSGFSEKDFASVYLFLSGQQK